MLNRARAPRAASIRPQSNFGLHRRSDAGLSLTELAIGVLIMGILAAIVVPFVFSGLGGASKDQVRVEAVRQISQALSLYSTRHGDAMGETSGCGQNGRGIGWVGGATGRESSAQYRNSIADCLAAEGLIDHDIIYDPTGTDWFLQTDRYTSIGHAFMKYNCDADGTVAYVFARLESLDGDRMPVSGICEGFTNPHANAARGTPYGYGMNYYVRVEVAG